jgi:hypothetical protein
MPEVPLAGERDDEFELFDHAGSVGVRPEVSQRLMIAPSCDERTGREPRKEPQPGHQAFTQRPHTQD